LSSLPPSLLESFENQPLKIGLDKIKKIWYNIDKIQREEGQNDS